MKMLAVVISRTKRFDTNILTLCPGGSLPLPANTQWLIGALMVDNEMPTATQEAFEHFYLAMLRGHKTKKKSCQWQV